MTMDSVTLTEGGGNVALGAINGEGTSALFFSMTGNGAVSDADTISFVSNNTLEDGGTVSCSFSIYDQPSQAQAGGSTGRIYTTGESDVITRASGFTFEMNAAGASGTVADVEDPNGAYYGFVGGTETFGSLTFDQVAGVLKADGTQVTLADIFDTDSTVTIEGDFSAADDIGDIATFSTTTSFDDSSATFDAFDTAGSGDLYYFETGDAPIKESEYTATLNAVANAGYTVSDVGPIHVGEITRNGTQLQAPLAQVPGNGWLSRMVLTNTGSVARPYEIAVTGEAGNTIGTGDTTGTVPANGTVVVDLTSVMTSFTGPARGTLNVTVAAPNSQIQGLYQIVNQNTGSISNHVMVRPGTN
jgi:hypothetical protein